MAVLPSRRSNMLLYIDKSDISAQRIKMIIAEKNVPTDVILVNPQKLPQDLLRANPHGTTPTLIDRDLVLYEPSIIAEYLDERFPHPPLLPVYPIARAKTRFMMLRIEREWYSLVKRIESSSDSIEISNAKKSLTESITSFAPVFSTLPYFLSEEFSLLDCSIVPLLWHLPKLGIDLPPQSKPIQDYAFRIFERPSFKVSLTLGEPEYDDA
jgi:RNA polymerase-associated protein